LLVKSLIGPKTPGHICFAESLRLTSSPLKVGSPSLALVRLPVAGSVTDP